MSIDITKASAQNRSATKSLGLRHEYENLLRNWDSQVQYQKTLAARQSFTPFMEKVWKDSKTGKRVQQGSIHRLWDEHIRYCHTNKLFAGIVAPWGHGKSETCMGYCLREIGQDTRIRIKLITNSDENSVARLETISQYIEFDEDYQAVYPHVHAAQKQEWSKHKIVVERPTRSKDGTIQAYSITGSGMGGRADLLFFDDIIDFRNAIAMPALRDKIKGDFWNTWMSRRDPDTRVIYIVTLWHPDDLTHDLMDNPQWCFLHQRISDDLSCIETRILPYERPGHPALAFPQGAPLVTI